MMEFLTAIPQAASSPYALIAYAIAAILFITAGARLRTTKLLLTKINSVPELDRRRALEIAAGVVLPASITPDEWIRHSRMRWSYMLIAAFLIALLAVVAIAIVNPSAKALADIDRTTRETASKTQRLLDSGNKSLANKIDQSTGAVITTVQDAALASLETMFPLTVRIEREVDGTVMHLDGSKVQRIISYDKDMAPMELYWGDSFHYSSSIESDSALVTDSGVFLEVRGTNGTRRFPIQLDARSEQTIRIPGSSPKPMEAYLINESGAKGVGLKILIYSADRERGRQEFRTALMNTTLNSAARRIYQEVSSNNASLRSGPSKSSSTLRSINEGTFVKVIERNDNGEWCRVRLPEGREGWIASSALRPITK